MDATLQSSPLFGINVREFGAVGDGHTDDAPAMQRALDAGQRRVVVPMGVYRLGRTLRIRSHTQLVVHPHAQLAMAAGAGVDDQSFLLANAEPDRGDADIHIEGGIWDGQCAQNPRGPDEPGRYSGVLIDFNHVRGLTLRNMVLRNSESYFTRFTRLRHFVIEGIRLQSTVIRPNQDGIHLAGDCEDGVVRDIFAAGLFTPNDDMVALNADDALHRVQNQNTVCGPIRRVRIENIRADDCHSFVRLLSVWSAIEDIDIRGLHGGCQMNVMNLDAARFCRVPLFDAKDPQYAAGVGMVQRVRVDDVHVFKSGPHKTPLLRMYTRLDDFSIQRFVRDTARDACPGAATFEFMMMQPVTIAVEGLDDSQRGSVVERSAVRELRWQRQATPHGATPWRVEAALASNDAFRMMPGGFDLLRVAHTHRE